jgi:uncharacterized protein (TIGR02246 family)
MRTFPRIVSLLVLSLFAVLLRAQPANPGDEKDVRGLGTQVQDAWNKADGKMLSDLWLTDGDYISSTGRTASGRVQVEKAFVDQWAGIYKGTKIAHTLTSIRFLRRDVAIGDGAFEITGMKDAAGKTLGPRSGLSTIVAVRKGSRWYIAALRGMVPSVPPGAPGK